ncbi:MAG: hypothetical protein H6679_03500 [Epsilonproteobacteria bacterium]|nr:hypothetical protein [Campylobacterota bacterium]
MKKKIRYLFFIPLLQINLHAVSFRTDLQEKVPAQQQEYFDKVVGFLQQAKQEKDLYQEHRIATQKKSLALGVVSAGMLFLLFQKYWHGSLRDYMQEVGSVITSDHTSKQFPLALKTGVGLSGLAVLGYLFWSKFFLTYDDAQPLDNLFQKTFEKAIKLWPDYKSLYDYDAQQKGDQLYHAYEKSQEKPLPEAAARKALEMLMVLLLCQELALTVDFENKAHQEECLMVLASTTIQSLFEVCDLKM